MAQRDVPILTETIPNLKKLSYLQADEDTIAELQTRLSAASFALMDELLNTACREMESILFETVAERLRAELPDLIDEVLSEHLRPGDMLAD